MIGADKEASIAVRTSGMEEPDLKNIWTDPECKERQLARIGSEGGPTWEIHPLRPDTDCQLTDYHQLHYEHHVDSY